MIIATARPVATSPGPNLRDRPAGPAGHQCQPRRPNRGPFGTAAGLGTLLLLGSALAAGAQTTESSAARTKLRVYVGTYTGKDSRGIYLLEMDPGTGELTPGGVAGESPNPSFLALHPNGRILYAVNEISDFKPGEGSVTAFSIDAGSGKLAELNRRSSRGAGPCHLVVDRAGRNVLVANYGGGNVAVLPIGEDGRLHDASGFVQHRGSSVDRSRQEGPHAHCITLDADNRFAFAADLGLDKILIDRFDPQTGRLTPNDPPAASVRPGSGPRHFAFHPGGRLAFVINEMASTVSAFRYEPSSGRLELLQTESTLPDGTAKGTNSTAELQVHPSGKFLYGSNRGHDSIAIFAIDAPTGRLRPAGHQPTGGKTPRNFALDPTGRFLLAANQDSGNVVVFRVNPETGALRPTGHSARVPMPVCVTFVPHAGPAK